MSKNEASRDLQSSRWKIDRRFLLRLMAASGLTSALARKAEARSPVGASTLEGKTALARDFLNPPPDAHPGAYWYWLGGNVTPEGITADLEAMHAAGISRPMLFTIGKSGKDTLVSPPATTLSPYWWKLFEHAVAEADRLGIVLAMNCCDGWGTAAGPWITPELSMQHVVWGEQTIEGGSRYQGPPQQPASLHGYYRDIAIIAFPFPENWSETSLTRKATITSNLPLLVSDANKVTDPANTDEIVDTEEPGWFTYAFEEPFTLRSITVHTPPAPGYAPGVYRAANSLDVEASDDGETFRRIGSLEYPKHGWQTDLTTLTHALPLTTARYFRLVHRTIPPQPYEEEYDFGQDTHLRFFSIVLSSEPRIHQWQGKTSEQWAISRRTTSEDVPDSACVQLSDVVDLTSRFSADGTLTWDAPEGRWRILRIGYTTTGKMNTAAGDAEGLECDRFNPEAATLLFDNWFGQALKRVGPRYAGKVLHAFHVDSWEAGTQNWSPSFRDNFQMLKGYDLFPYIALMTGVPMVSADVSERVLLDVRHAINALMQQNFFKTMATLAHEHGCVFSAEPANPTFPADGMEHARYVDLPMGEFWLHTPRNDKPTDIKDAVNGSRLYGKKCAGAESFTEGLMDWRENPFIFKALGDHNYCEGINRLMLHVYAQQPWTNRAPGITLNGIGTFFSRTQTWWKPGKAWFDYLKRCHAMLQSGRAVSDLCYFTGENIPARSLLPRQLSIPLPDSYAYDSINRDAILHLSRVKDGMIVLDSGARYRVLILPDDRLLTPEIAEKLREFVNGGVTIVGPRPERSPSFVEWPTADRLVQTIAQELWGDLDGVQRIERRVSAGRVVWGRPLPDVLAELDLAPDVDIKLKTGTPAPPGHVEWTHRRSDEWDLYFLSNQTNGPLRIDVAFRVHGRVPELWHPDTGNVETLAFWQERDGRSNVPLTLDPAGSVFVLFARPSKDTECVTAITGPNSAAVHLRQENGQIEALLEEPGTWTLHTRSGRVVPLALREQQETFAVSGPWALRFSERLAHPITLRLQTLESWTTQTNPNVKYYSGTASYSVRFTLPNLRPDHRLYLELGEVHDLAHVRLNGHDLGVLWKPPFTIDVTRAAKAGRNTMEIAITNTWRNRLIGDYGKPQDERTTFVVPVLRKGQSWLPGGPGTELSPAGLLGPVRIRSMATVRLG